MNYDYDYYEKSLFAETLAVGMLFSVFFFVVAIYVVTAFFTMKLLKNAGHRTPVSGWVPVWSTASLLQIAGIKQPWIWTVILFAGSSIGSLIPFLGVLISLAIFVVAIILTVYMAKGIQAGVGTGSTGGIVLAILLPIVWIIWMALESGKNEYNRDAAIAEGSSMPMNWFGESNLYEPFDSPLPAASGAYPQNPYSPPSSSMYSPPQSTQGFSTPQYAPYEEPTTGNKPREASEQTSESTLGPESTSANTPQANQPTGDSDFSEPNHQSLFPKFEDGNLNESKPEKDNEG